MGRGRTFGAGLLAALVVVAACGGKDERFGVGRELPDVTLPALIDGAAPLALAELAGPAVINLWATWCAPCRAELPAFQQASVAHPNVRFVGVDIGEDAPEALDFLAEIGVDTDAFAQFADPEAVLTDALGVSALPITIVLGADERVTVVHLGPLTVDDLTAALADL